MRGDISMDYEKQIEELLEKYDDDKYSFHSFDLKKIYVDNNQWSILARAIYKLMEMWYEDGVLTEAPEIVMAGIKHFDYGDKLAVNIVTKKVNIEGVV